MILYSKQLCTTGIVEGVEAVVCLLVEVISPLCGNSSTAVVSPAETGKLAGKCGSLLGDRDSRSFFLKHWGRLLGNS